MVITPRATGGPCRRPRQRTTMSPSPHASDMAVIRGSNREREFTRLASNRSLGTPERPRGSDQGGRRLRLWHGPDMRASWSRDACVARKEEQVHLRAHGIPDMPRGDAGNGFSIDAGGNDDLAEANDPGVGGGDEVRDRLGKYRLGQRMDSKGRSVPHRAGIEISLRWSLRPSRPQRRMPNRR